MPPNRPTATDRPFKDATFDAGFLAAASRHIGGLGRSEARTFAARARSRGIPFERAAVGHSAALSLARRCPALLLPLDAGCALLRRDDALRRALLLVAAVMETDPELARLFLPRSRSMPLLVLLAVMAGTRAVLATVLGIALLSLLPKRDGHGVAAS